MRGWTRLGAPAGKRRTVRHALGGQSGSRTDYGLIASVDEQLDANNSNQTWSPIQVRSTHLRGGATGGIESSGDGNGGGDGIRQPPRSTGHGRGVNQVWSGVQRSGRTAAVSLESYGIGCNCRDFGSGFWRLQQSSMVGLGLELFTVVRAIRWMYYFGRRSSTSARNSQQRWRLSFFLFSGGGLLGISSNGEALRRWDLAWTDSRCSGLHVGCQRHLGWPKITPKK